MLHNTSVWTYYHFQMYVRVPAVCGISHIIVDTHLSIFTGYLVIQTQMGTFDQRCTCITVITLSTRINSEQLTRSDLL